MDEAKDPAPALANKKTPREPAFSTPVTREALYEEVWSEPMTAVAARYRVSESFLARVCARLNVPTPPRGYWARDASGKATLRLVLPEKRPQDELAWSRGGDVLEAVKLAPTLVPAAALAGRLLGEAGDTRRASRIVETAWKANPHPELAEAFAYVQPGDSARDRLARVETLAEKTPGNIEGALAVARAALDAQEFAAARKALSPLSIAPSQRVAVLMAELEEKEHSDEGRAREWMARAVHARRDPVWTADGFVSDHWMPVSPVTGRLDAFQWKDPIAELDGEGEVIDDDRHNGQRAPASPPPSAEIKPPAPAPDTISLAPIPSPGRNLARTGPAVPIAPVIPLVQVPDDPGPEPEPQLEPETEPGPQSSGDGWRRLRGLFK